MGEGGARSERKHRGGASARTRMEWANKKTRPPFTTKRKERTPPRALVGRLSLPAPRTAPSLRVHAARSPGRAQRETGMAVRAAPARLRGAAAAARRRRPRYGGEGDRRE